MADNGLTVGDYLIQRLYDLGVRHVFGIPGDYVLQFYDRMSKSRIRVINTSDEQGAGFAADAYARINGIGAVCITFSVGGLKVVNTTAEAYAEQSPVVIISGSPGLKERREHAELHHKVHDYDTQRRVFEQVTVAQAVLDDPRTAICEIERVLHAALKHKRPVYIEIPRDIAFMTGDPACTMDVEEEISDPCALGEAVSDAVRMINSAKHPVILADVEVHRYGLQDRLVQLAERANIPVAAMIMGKSVISEDHPLYMGVYAGAMGRDDVRLYVEESDCLIMLGTLMTDLNLGMFTCNIDKRRSIYATAEKLSICCHNYEGAAFVDFVNELAQGRIDRHELGHIPHPEAPQPFTPVRGDGITVKRLFNRLNAQLDENTIVIADVGESLFGAIDMRVRNRTEFFAPIVYGSMGFSVPGAVGAQLANPNLRPLVLVGDGAFQMTGMELSTIARYGLNPVVVVLNNRGYSTERSMLDGPYNDVYPWRFGRVADILGVGRGFTVDTEEQLDEAIDDAWENTDSFSIIDVHLGPADRSVAMERLGERALPKSI